MRKGTFSVQTATANSSKHNSREFAPKYLIDSSAKNYYELIKKDSDFISEAQAIYKEKIKQTMQKKQVTNLIQETVLTLKPNQDENDVKKLFQELHKKYGGHELLEVAVHRDEGHFFKDNIAYYPTKNILRKGEEWFICNDSSIKKPKVVDFDKKVNINEFTKIYNYHAHAKFSMFDRRTGKSARMQKKDMSERIKFVSDFLGLEFNPNSETSRVKKSVNFVKDEHLARARELEKQQDLKQELAVAEDLKEINKRLREELKANGAKREDYAKLEKLNKDLKEQIKQKDLTIDELNTKVDEYKQSKSFKNAFELFGNGTTKFEETKSFEKFVNVFNDNIEVKEERMLNFKKKYTVELTQEFKEKPETLEDLSFFKIVIDKFNDFIEIIKEQAKRILWLEDRAKKLIEENKELKVKVKELSQDKELGISKRTEKAIKNETKKTNDIGFGL